jgi:hypothetical protein
LAKNTTIVGGAPYITIGSMYMAQNFSVRLHHQHTPSALDSTHLVALATFCDGERDATMRMEPSEECGGGGGGEMGCEHCGNGWAETTLVCIVH